MRFFSLDVLEVRYPGDSYAETMRKSNIDEQVRKIKSPLEKPLKGQSVGRIDKEDFSVGFPGGERRTFLLEHLSEMQPEFGTVRLQTKSLLRLID